MLLMLAGGLVIGLLMGALGGGGAILAVPLLVYGAGMAPASATLASLIIVGLGAATGIAAHARTVQWRRGTIFGALGIVGASVGRTLSVGIDGAALLLAFAGLLVVVASLMITKALKVKLRSPTHPPELATFSSPSQLLRLVGAASGVGFLTGFFGVGGGFAIVPALTLILDLGMGAAVGTSLLVILINSLIALGLSFNHLATVDWAVLAPLLAATMLGVLGGGWVGKRIPRHILQLSFACFLYLISIYIVATTLTGLAA
ncbi:sulfite exporter TauE/SafE family protein [Rothia nasimurium]|uniref:sulfite exporter TauE/SafE family protein n=1 Tax=Rothia nasimurium TaxID=85336 RepID=UPI001627A2BE|nr:sulfite exporter TauE/SafE family protein [Rothia nasimurium]